MQQFNLNVEHQLPGNVVFTWDTLARAAAHILVDGLNLNVTRRRPALGAVLRCRATHLGAATLRRLSPFGVIANNNDVGRARYDSLQTKVETKSSRHGLYALLGYTWSRTFDSGFPDGVGTFPGATYWPLPGAEKLDWSLSQLNVDQQFTASVIYDLPFGRGKAFGANMERSR